MKCKHYSCTNETVGRSQYCCASCKTLYNRNKATVTKSVTVQTVTQVRPLDKVMFDVLYRRVCAYPGLEWKRSPEYDEIMHRLRTLTVEQLELEGQFVPCWKYKQEAAA